jgi:hypothetical protein
MTRAKAFCWPVVLALASLASLLALPAAAHTIGDNPAASSAPPAAASDIVSGTIDQLVIEDRVHNTTTSYPLLVQDDGTTVPLVGTQAATLRQGTRVGILGRWQGRQFEVAQSESLAGPASTTPPTTASDVEGTLAVIHADDFSTGRSRYMYHVRDDAGAVTSLQATVLPSGLRGGMRIHVSGQRGTDASSLRPQRITILADPTGSGGAQSGVVQRSTTSSLVLVIMANFNDTAVPALTQAQAMLTMQTGAGSVANFYSEMSYGQQLLASAITPLWVTMNLSSTSTAATTCDFGTIGTSADAASTAAGYNPALYNFVVYLFPALSSCGWNGLAYVGSPHKSWINGTGSFIPLVIAHEMGHNFGLLHAGSLNCGSASIGGSCSVAEYGDPWDTMGNQRAMHFNAMQKSILTWISAAGVKTHNSGTASYTLSPLEQGGGSVYAVKIPTSNTNRTYWLEFRQPIGFDAALSSFPNNGAQVRVSSPFEWSSGSDDTEIVDMTPATPGTFTDSALVVGQTYVDGSTGVSVTVTSATASALTVSVTKGGGSATTTSLTSSSNPSTIGANVTFTASVTGTSPTGTVNFMDGASSISGCSAVALAGSGNTRTAACSTASLSAATHSITAVYSGDATNNPSTSSAVSQVVNKGTSTTSIATSLTPSTVGASVTFTASVSGTAPTGTVNFKDGASSISGCSAVALGGSGNIRTAQCATSALTAGTHSMTAVYSGDSSNSGSTSATLSQVVNGMTATTTTLGTSLNPSTVGANVTFTATVTGSSPTGTVNFKDGAASIASCSAVALGGSGNTLTAQCATTSLTPGTHSITAAYSGNASNNASTSSALSQVVNGAASTTTLGSSLNPATAGASVTFTATVTGTAPTGAVNFKDGAASIASCSAVALGGSGNTRTAQCATSALATGTHSITAVYGGDASNNSSTSSALSQVVNGVASTTTLGSSLNPSTAGGSVTFTATVTGTSPTGMVNFKDGAVSIASCSAVALGGSGNTRTAQCATSGLTTGTHSITAVYGGDASNNGSTSSALSQVVNAAASTTTLGSSLNPSTVGASVTFTATVTGSSPTGTVNFKDGAASIASCSAVALGGSGNTLTAQCATSALTAGTHNITAAYSGNASNNASTSSALSQVVNGVASTTTLGSSINPSTAGGSVTFTATVTGSSPTGTVNFKDGAASIASCSAVALGGSGNTRTAQCATSALTTGTHSITAVYGGDASNGPSTSSALSQVVNGVGSTTALGTSLNPSTVGASVTFTATVTGSSPTGTVNFKDGASSISGCSAVALAGSGNTLTAQCATSALTAATHSITAAYSGNASNGPSTSSALSQVVNKVASNSTAASSVNPATVGVNVTFTASVTGSAPTGTVNFKDGAASIASCSAVAVGGSGNSRTAQCATTALTAGTHSITAVYSGDATNNGSTSSALSQVVNSAGPAQSINVALASNGGVASASSTFSGNYPASAINNGDRAGLNFGAGGVWKDGTLGAFPDWVEIDFNGTKTIDHVVVYSAQDNSRTPVDPSDTLTFTKRGLTAFSVQTWNGSAWVTQGSVSGNNLVKRTVSFAAVATAKIRVQINSVAGGSYSYVTELEAWTVGSAPPPSSTMTVSASANPAQAGQGLTFTASVTGSSPTGTVAFTDGTTPISGCGSVPLTGSGNTKNATCTTSFASTGRHRITGTYGGDAGNATSSSAMLLRVM